MISSLTFGAAASCSQEPGTQGAFRGAPGRPERGKPGCASLPAPRASAGSSDRGRGRADNSGVRRASGLCPRPVPRGLIAPTSPPPAAGGGAGEERVATSFPQAEGAWDARWPGRTQYPPQGPGPRSLDLRVNLTHPGWTQTAPEMGAVPPSSCSQARF